MRQLCMLMVIAGVLAAQEYRSTVTGRIIDPSGAGVPNAKVVLVQGGTNARLEAVTDSNGIYTLPMVLPGSYNLSLEVSGFKKYVHNELAVGSNDRIAEDIELETGESSEVVGKTGEMLPANQATAATGRVVRREEADQWPTNGATPLGLLRTATGVAPAEVGAHGSLKAFETAKATDVALGAGPRGNEFLLDGVPNMSTASRQFGFMPSIEAVQEVKAELFQVDAGTGSTMASTLNFVTRSGGSAFHGDVYGNFQPSGLGSYDYFLRQNGIAKPTSKFNQFGGTVSGPLLNSENRKAFFLFNAEALKSTTNEMNLATVPTAAERTGDFSKLLSYTSANQIYDPATGVMGATRLTRTAFAGNLIPNTRLSTVGQKLLSYYPAANRTGLATGENNYIAATPTEYDYKSYLGRVDLHMGQKNRMFVQAHRNNYTSSTPGLFANLTNGSSQDVSTEGAMIDNVYMVSPKTWIDLRGGITRSKVRVLANGAGFDPTTLGLPTSMKTASTRLGFPSITLDSGYAPLGGEPSKDSPYTVAQVYGAVSRVRGKMTLKAGGDLRMAETSVRDSGYSAGQFNFGTNYTMSGSNGYAQGLGGGLASLLLGLPTSGQYDIKGAYTYRSNLYNVFFQDDWRLASTLTVNVGLRATHETPVRERYDRLVTGFDASLTNSVSTPAATAYANMLVTELTAAKFRAKGGLVYADDQQKSSYYVRWGTIEPRAGMAWAPEALNGRTVVRLGVGIFNDTLGTQLTGPTTGYDQSTSVVATNNSFLTPYATLSNPFPMGIASPTGSKLGVNSNLGNAVRYYSDTMNAPYSSRANLEVQQQVNPSMSFQFGLLANRQKRLPYDREISGVGVLPYLSAKLTRDQSVINNLSSITPNPFAGLLPGTTRNGSTISKAELLQSYPQFQSVTEASITDGRGTYTEFYFRLQKRFSSGLSGTFSYSRSKNLAATYALNAGDGNLYYGVSDLNYPNRVLFLLNYDLPFGKGKKYLGKASRAMDAVVGGWTLDALFTGQSGPALRFGNIIYFGSSLDSKPREQSEAFNIDGFEKKPAFQLGYNRRSVAPTFSSKLRADAMNNFDFSLLKKFTFTERVGANFHIEAFNGLNRTQFGAANTIPTSAAFTTINSQANQSRTIQAGFKIHF
jgi:hypothetical protein